MDRAAATKTVEIGFAPDNDISPTLVIAAEQAGQTGAIVDILSGEGTAKVPVLPRTSGFGTNIEPAPLVDRRCLSARNVKQCKSGSRNRRRGQRKHPMNLAHISPLFRRPHAVLAQKLPIC